MWKLTLVLLTVFFCFRAEARIVTSVMNGDFSNNNVWDCNCVPVAADTIVIAHHVVLDFDFVSTGGITITPYDHLDCIGNYTNLTMNGGFLVNNKGAVTMGTYSQIGGSFFNNGDFHVWDDILFDQTNNVLILGTVWNQHMRISDSLVVSSSASVVVDSGQVHSGMLINHGTITVEDEGLMLSYLQSVNYGTLSAGGLSVDFYLSLYNYGTINVDSYLYPQLLYNYSQVIVSAGAWIYASEITNGDTIGGPELLINDGTIWTVARFRNNADVSGAGKFCTQDSTINHGTVSGTLDFCDQTGSNWDINTGTEAITVTHCTNNNCSIGIAEQTSTTIDIYPNPSGEFIKLQLPVMQNGIVEVIDITGRVVASEDLMGKEMLLNVLHLPEGMYTIVVRGENQIYSGRFIKE